MNYIIHILIDVIVHLFYYCLCFITAHDSKKTYTNFINRAIETDMKEEKQISQRKVSRLSPTAKSM